MVHNLAHKSAARVIAPNQRDYSRSHIVMRPLPTKIVPLLPLLLLRAAPPRMDVEPDLGQLTSRIAQVQSGVWMCKAVTIRETLVPGQRLRLTAPPQLVELFLRREPLPIVLLGHRGQQVTSRGVEATLEGPPLYRPVVPGIHPEGTADIVILARRVCDLLSHRWMMRQRQ